MKKRKKRKEIFFIGILSLFLSFKIIPIFTHQTIVQIYNNVAKYVNPAAQQTSIVLHSSCPQGKIVTIERARAQALTSDEQGDVFKFGSSPRKHFPVQVRFHNLDSAIYDPQVQTLMCGYHTSAGLEVLYGHNIPGTNASDFTFDQGGLWCNQSTFLADWCKFSFVKTFNSLLK